MMMEQQTTLKNYDLQDRWKICIKTTCLAVRVIKSADKIRELFETIKTLIQNVVHKISEAFAEFRNLICNKWDIYHDLDIPLNPKRNKRPSYKDRVTTNVTGFSKPILCRARSNCRK